MTTQTSLTGLTVLTGVLVPGIRAKCRILDTGERRFALVGVGVGTGVGTGVGIEALRRGDRVQVVGQERPDLVTPCGAAFVVQHLERL